MSDYSQPFSRLLPLTAHAWRLAVDRRLKESGLSMSNWMAITTVATATEPPTQKALAQLLGLEEASVLPLGIDWRNSSYWRVYRLKKIAAARNS